MAKRKNTSEKKDRKNPKAKQNGHQLLTRKKKKCARSYSVEMLQQALNAISEGLSLREAASKYGVPTTTLHAKLKNMSPLECKMGPSTILSEEVEEEIVLWALYRTERGFPVTKNHLLECVEKYVKRMKIKNPFKNDRPGVHWYTAFMKRHPILTPRIAQKLTTTRVSVTERDLRNWFSTTKALLRKKNLLSLSPERIFNLDESSFMLNPDDNAVSAEKGARSVCKIIGVNKKATVTVLFIAAASGEILPPMILFDTKNPPRKHILEKIPKEWGIGYTERGGMTSEIYFNYITNILYKWLLQKNYEFPVILFVDGHKSQVSLPLVKFCIEKKIELVSLYPNATHLIQPLDIAFFGPLKDIYRQCHWEWRFENHVIQFQKYMVAIVIQSALDSKDFTGNVINGFRAAGLCPFNPDAVNYNILKKQKKNNDGNTEIVNENNTLQISKGCDKNLDFLHFFEENIISPDTLQLFEQHETCHSWSGEATKEELFECWRKMKRLCDNIVDRDEDERSDKAKDGLIFTERPIVAPILEIILPDVMSNLQSASDSSLTPTNNAHLSSEIIAQAIVVDHQTTPEARSTISNDDQVADMDELIRSDEPVSPIINC